MTDEPEMTAADRDLAERVARVRHLIDLTCDALPKRVAAAVLSLLLRERMELLKR